MRTIRRAAWIGGSAAAFVALAGASACAQTSASLREVSFGITPPTAVTWPIYVGDDLGFYKRYGLSPELIVVGSAAAGAQQMAAGEIDLSIMSSTQLVEAVQGGADIEYFCNSLGTPPYTLVGQKQITKYADLKGKLIIVGGVNDITRVFADKMLAKAGLKPGDYDYTYAGTTPDRYAALRSGSVAAAILFPPFDFRAEADGYPVIGTLAQAIPEFPFLGLAVRRAFARSNPGVVVAYAKGYLRAARWLTDPANRDAATAILVKHTNGSPDDARKTYDELIVRDKVFPTTGVMSQASIGVVISSLVGLGVVKAPAPPAEKFFDNSFVRQALAELAREPR
jgi:NitT/TauT family transport system substrate-binding protein